MPPCRIQAHNEQLSEFERGRIIVLKEAARLPDLSPVEHVQDMMGRRLHLPGNIDDLAQRLEQICQEIPQETMRVLYHLCHVVWQLTSRLEVVQHFTKLINV
ncbi:hypothetical protein TNCV_1176651 [Trichonephila clavipes]|nr:hypothetical protein TNCV_1176651 [Trichonephila clavipes]